ncbi:hypothetical protein ACIRD3_18540 [Kitasatospora sp. NPDC093550]|uniref:hypothetical protein n=1 Tax=Kitasatospora sp. NPDC093550 TaxID=3364089 RepID=UPI003803B9DA
MAATGLKGRGRERSDTVRAWVWGGLTATLDIWLLTSLWGRAHGQTDQARRFTVNATLVLLAVALLGALLGAAVAGRRSTPQRRRRCAMLGALVGHLAVPMVLAVVFVVHPPTVTIPW